MLNNTMSTVLAALSIGALALGCGDSLEVKNSSPKGSVGGVIVDAVTRAPLEGVTVSVVGGGTVRGPVTSLEDGTFSVTKVPAGEIIVMIDGPEGLGYRSVWLTRVLDDSAGEFPAAKTVTLGPIGLIAGTHEFTLRVLDLQGRPVSMYDVGLRHFVQYLDFASGTTVNRGEVITNAVTGTDGRVTFGNLPPFYQLSAGINATGFLNLGPLDDDGVLSYTGGTQIVNLRATGDPTPDVILDPELSATLSIRASNISDLWDPPGSSGTASVLAINDVAQVAFNLPIETTPTVIISDAEGVPLENQPGLTVSDDNITLLFGNFPLVPGNEYNIYIHAVAAVGEAKVSGDFVGSFFTASLNDLGVDTIARDAVTQVVAVEFSEPIGIGGGVTTTLNGANCVLFFDFDLNNSGTIGDFANERGASTCSVVLSSNETDPDGLVGRSGYTKNWRFTAPMQSDGVTPLPTGTRFDIVFSRVSSAALVVENSSGAPAADFTAPNDIPIAP